MKQETRKPGDSTHSGRSFIYGRERVGVLVLRLGGLLNQHLLHGISRLQLQLSFGVEEVGYPGV